MKWTGKIILSVAVVAALALLAIALLPKPVGVETASVERGAFEQTVDEEGKTRVRERYTVSAPLSGYLLRIGLEAGDPVKQNQLLAEIVPSPPSLLDVRTERELRERLGAAEAERLRAIAAVERAKAALDQANSDLKRTRQLSKEGLAPPAQLERDELSVKLRTRELAAARFENEVAEHQVELARAALLQARKGPGANHVGEKFEIHSPVPGRVLRVLQESEGSVQTGAPLLEIADPTDLEVVADVLTT
ncbi:MAG TPA: HlyD family efflux transporter periplasmic adaptor subunit, partial [Nitrospiria bacterium]|nr:HlyD family efflux transporter periplasmic adaptor subunit [Nitrospiria bacterium]